MGITTNNQKPTELNSFYLGSLASTFDPYDTVKQDVIRPLFQPLIPGSPVSILQDGKPLNEDDITSMLFDCCSDIVNTQAEDLMKEVFGQTLTYYDKTMLVQSVYAVQAGKKQQMLIPSSRVRYLPMDVIDSAKQFMAGQVPADNFFATLAFYTKVDTFGYYFANDAAWDQFKTYLAGQIATIQNILPADTIQLCNNIQNIKLDRMTEGFVLRDDSSQNNDPYSFARLFPFYLMMYEQERQKNNLPECTAGHMPFSISDNFCPRTILLVNVEKHAHAHPNDIQREWDIIQNALRMRPKVLGNNQIANLTAVARMAAKMRGQAQAAQTANFQRSAMIRFRKTPPTSVDLYKYIVKVYKRTQFVQQSENAVKNKKLTYNRPSRRDPNNWDRMGKTNVTIYRPDLHIYLDCSGSISEREYQDAIKIIIKLAKKLNINLYFNSFSSYMSECTKLPMQGKTVREIYDIFRNIPKVSGGTSYEQIWHYINRSQKMLREVSVIISDFEWTAPNHYVKHPPFLFYAPISSSNWKKITNDATDFLKSMLHIEPNIRKHIMM